MSHIIEWLTPAGTIATVAENEYFEFQLDAYDKTGSALVYTVIAGKITNGLQLSRSGLIQGVASVENADSDALEYLQTFTVRATNNKGKVSDRTFSVITRSITQPQIIPKDISLGTWYDGYFYDHQFEAINQNTSSLLTWELLSGELPDGLELTSTGRLFGYINPLIATDHAGELGWDKTNWDKIVWDLQSVTAESKTYRFSLQVFDGARFDQSTYTFTVQTKSTISADNTEITIDNETITIDSDNKYDPYIITQPQELPSQRQLTNFAFRVVGKELTNKPLHYGFITNGIATFDQGAPLSVIGFDAARFDQPSQSVPAGVTIDELSGWITGTLDAQIEEEKTYQFQVHCWTEDDNEVVLKTSQPVTFTLTVFGDRNNTIEWITPSDLGVMTNGDVSELSITAVSKKGKTLNYRLKEGTATPEGVSSDSTVITYSPRAKNRLPQGLTLLPNGLISGRATFEHFSLDNRATTFDKNKLAFDNVYEFTVTASDDTTPGVISNATVSADKTFSVRVSNFNQDPYENIYLKALPNKEQRSTFLSIVNNNDLFPEQLIYRSGDPWFGRAPNIKFLFAAGLTPSLASTYIAEMENNHYHKQIDLGNVKTAIATDENFNVKYEIVYVEVVDKLAQDSKSASLVINRTNEVKSPYNVPPYTQVYPNSLDNMKTEVGNIGYNNKGALPQWMLNPQEDGRVLGFTRAVILAYTVPGASKLIAYRLKQNQITFSNIEFAVDRYQLDHTLSKNYNIANTKFIESSESTFDKLPPNSALYPYAGTVNFALTVPFDQINGRTVKYIKLHGGLDGYKNIQSGQLVMFAIQENFNASRNLSTYVKDPYDSNIYDGIDFNSSVTPEVYISPNDGWNVDSAPYGNGPYGSDSYANATVVPGYAEKLLTGATNMRGGIWRVELSESEEYENKLVSLVFVQEVELNQHVLVGIGGRTFGETKIYYDPIIKLGNTVPSYSILETSAKPSNATTRFDGGGTRFYNNRDMYAVPETLDVYLKFPKSNVYL